MVKNKRSIGKRAADELSLRLYAILQSRSARNRGRSSSSLSPETQPSGDPLRGLAAVPVEELTVDTRPASASLPQLSEAETVRFTGTVFTVIGLILAGLILQLTLVGLINYSRDQQVNFDNLRFNLANATAPVGQAAMNGNLVVNGTPVAIISAPSIGLHSVVVEGTSSEVTISGPGHRRDTVLPGQAGTSVIYGRQAAYGGPFSGIGSLAVGATIETITGQGKSTYEVVGVRFNDANLPKGVVAGEGRLTLVSASGVPFFPTAIVRVDAKLTSQAFPTPVPVISAAALNPSEQAMVGNSDLWPLLALGLVALLICSLGFIVSRRFWGKWQTWIVAVPVLLAVGAFTASEIVALLPNLL